MNTRCAAQGKCINTCFAAQGKCVNTCLIVFDAFSVAPRNSSREEKVWTDMCSKQEKMCSCYS